MKEQENAVRRFHFKSVHIFAEIQSQIALKIGVCIGETIQAGVHW